MRIAIGLLAIGLAFGAVVAADAPRLQEVKTGKVVTLAPGPAVLHVVFFATWCPACVDELPKLAELRSRWGDERYRLVLVAVQNRQSLPKLSSFATSQGSLPGELLYDFEGQAERAFKAGDLPMHVVLDAEGHELARAGALDRSVGAAIQTALSGRGGPGPKESRP
jgi:thiol-disulfide isomerase/thioredoxin